MGSSGINRRVALVIGVVLAALAIVPAGAGATVFYPPTVSPATKTAEGFELKGTVYDYGGTTTYHFEYGTTTAYGAIVPMPDADASGALYTPVSQAVTGLMPDTTYHYRLVSTNSVEGTAMSADATFSTATSTSTPTPTPTPSPSAPPSYPYPGQPGESGSSTPTVGGSGPKPVAKALTSAGQTLLTTTKGRTLYSLSAERHGKFICTEMSGCTSIWHPLTVAAGVVPKGPVKLGTIHRPEGQIQVTYRGLPLYTFASDKRPGQVKGEGLMDVGTWHAALVPSKGNGQDG